MHFDEIADILKLYYERNPMEDDAFFKTFHSIMNAVENIYDSITCTELFFCSFCIS